eukprot:357510-Chlamydomonas_euryale.AAC.7
MHSGAEQLLPCHRHCHCHHHCHTTTAIVTATATATVTATVTVMLVFMCSDAAVYIVQSQNLVGCKEQRLQAQATWTLSPDTPPSPAPTAQHTILFSLRSLCDSSCVLRPCPTPPHTNTHDGHTSTPQNNDLGCGSGRCSTTMPTHARTQHARTSAPTFSSAFEAASDIFAFSWSSQAT